MTTQRERALDAAIELLGTQGLKALTHRRVDQQADLPPGSTSNYFRTRDALLIGVAEAIPERELRGARGSVAISSVDDLVALLAGMIDQTTHENRTMTAARLVLFVEASHHQGLREAIWRGRGAMAGFLEPVLQGLGARDPKVAAATLMACAEGVILHRVARGDETDVRPLIELVTRGALLDSAG